MVDYQNSLPVVFGFYDEGPHINTQRRTVHNMMMMLRRTRK